MIESLKVNHGGFVPSSAVVASDVGECVLVRDWFPCCRGLFHVQRSCRDDYKAKLEEGAEITDEGKRKL